VHFSEWVENIKHGNVLLFGKLFVSTPHLQYVESMRVNWFCIDAHNAMELLNLDQIQRIKPGILFSA
jgi:hypothetical protein